MIAPSDELMVATYNIEHSLQVAKIANNIFAMAKQGIHVFCLQEIVNSPHKELIIETILKKLGKDWQAAYHIATPSTRINIGSGIIWSNKVLQLEKAEKFSFPLIKRLGLHESTFGKLVGGSSFPIERKAITCDFVFNQQKIRITSLHLDHVGGTTHRIKQLSSFLTQLPETKHDIICGDFNTFDLLKTGREKALLHKAFGKNFVDAAEKIETSADIYNINMENGFPLFRWFIKTFHIHIRRRLDYIWVKNLQIVNCYKLEISGSDHFPIVAKLRLK